MRQFYYKQSGIALIVFLTIFLLSATAILLHKLNNRSDFVLENQVQTARALAQAKEALIGYAASYYDLYPGMYGFLPCPDVDAKLDSSGKPSYPEGVEHGNCTGRNKSSLGRFPWRTLGLEPLRDGAGECLWYAVSGPYKNATTASARTEMLNEDTNGLFKVFGTDGTQTLQLAGSSAPERAVAVIIAPGKIFSNQNTNQNRRTPTDNITLGDRIPYDKGVEICGGNYTASNYLELEQVNGINNASLSAINDISNPPIYPDSPINADTIVKFIRAQNNPNDINDKIVYITREELFEAIYKRNDFDNSMRCLTRIAAYCVANYATTNTNFSSGDKRLPWPAPVDLTDYRDDAEYDDHDNTESYLSGRLPDDVRNSNSQIGKINEVNKVLPDFLITRCDFSSIPSDPICDNIISIDSLEKCDLRSTESAKILLCDAKNVLQAARSLYNYTYYYSSSEGKYKIRETCTNTNPDQAKCQDVKDSNRAVETFKHLWENWKDHLFYAVAEAYEPNANSTTPVCDSSNCLKVDTNYYAAVIIFAGKRLAGQIRNAPPPINDLETKNNSGNYLEENNASHIETGGLGGNETYQYESKESPKKPFNDILYAIKNDLNVTICPEPPLPSP